MRKNADSNKKLEHYMKFISMSSIKFNMILVDCNYKTLMTRKSNALCMETT